jgi:hypothetical protein
MCVQRRSYVGLHDVAAVRQAIGVTEDHVGMDLGRSILLQGNVANEGEHLDLLMERDLLVRLPLTLEVAQYHVAEATDGGKVSGCQAILRGKLE